MSHLDRVMSFLQGQVWAIVPEKLAALREVIRLRAAGERLSDEEIRHRLGMEDEDYGEPARPKPVRTAGVAILPLYGFICPKANMITQYSGGTSLEAYGRAFRAAIADQSVGSIVMDIDSGGGSVYGVEELWAEIFAARKTKPIKAVVNPCSGSAAYWLATAAEEIVVTPSGDLGSIGVYMLHEDISKHLDQEGVAVTLISAGQFKTEQQPYGPLSDEAKAYLQGQVESCYATFVKAVAKGRGVSTAAVLKDFGQGRMVLAREAVARKMADRIGTLEETVGRLSGRKAAGGTRSEADGGGVLAVGEGATLLLEEYRQELEALLSDPAAPPEPVVPADGAAERERRRADVELQELG